MLSGVVVMAFDLRLQIAGLIPAAALLCATLGQVVHSHLPPVTKQYNLVPA